MCRAPASAASYGTGSWSPGPHGWQRRMRRGASCSTLSASPLCAPPQFLLHRYKPQQHRKNTPVWRSIRTLQPLANKPKYYVAFTLLHIYYSWSIAPCGAPCIHTPVLVFCRTSCSISSFQVLTSYHYILEDAHVAPCTPPNVCSCTAVYFILCGWLWRVGVDTGSSTVG